MPKIPTAPITEEMLHDIAEEFDILDKIRDGRLTTEQIDIRPASDLSLPNAYGRMLKHYSTGPNPRHIATSHQTIGAPVPHWHVTDLVFQEIRFVRPPKLPPAF